MCDYSLHIIQTRAAKVGDLLTTRKFNWSTTGFSAPEDTGIAVCLKPGTELAFAKEVRRERLWPWSRSLIRHKTAVFRQINTKNRATHHDALEFPDGQVVLLTLLREGQKATVLQLPVTHESAKESKPEKTIPEDEKVTLGLQWRKPTPGGPQKSLGPPSKAQQFSRH